MKTWTRREVCVSLPMVAAAGARAAQVHATEAPPMKTQNPQTPAVAAHDAPASPTPLAAGPALLAGATAYPFDGLPVRKMANGGESRDIAHGALATGETVTLHQSMQVVGAVPNPLHVIQHSEFIFVREGQLEFQHEDAGKVVSQTVGPGGTIYVAFGTNHTVKNAGDVPAKYFVIAIGGDAK